MAPHRRILLSSDTNGQDCSIHPCNASFPPPISIAVSDLTRHFSNALIAAVSIISAAFFLALTYYAVLRRRRRRHRHPPSLPPVGNPTDDDDTSSSYSNDDERDHHIWHIRTVGLDESTVKSIGAYTYRHGELTAADCSVCLGEIHDGEMVRLLPKCGHTFHVSCIDTWLRTHVSCPLCRAHIVCPTSDVDGGLGSSDMAENTQSGVLEDDGGSEIRVRVSVDLSPEVPENSEAILRSVSMDSVAMGAIVLRVEQEEGFGEERKEGNFGEESVSENNGKEGSSSKEIGGSLSSSGMGFFSRLGRARSSSVLPL